jgi:hypothetical protein
MTTYLRAAGALTIALTALSGGMAQAQQKRPGTADQGVAARQAASPEANPQAVALAEFQKRMDEYFRLKRDLEGKLKPLSRTADSAELTARQDTLAAGMREARKTAKPGDIISSRVAEQIRMAVTSDFRKRQANAKRAVVEEVPDNVRPAVNGKFPDDAPLATVPPLLLRSLPTLPDKLQYRFLGRHIVLLDIDTRLIVDYVPNVLPPH